MIQKSTLSRTVFGSIYLEKYSELELDQNRVYIFICVLDCDIFICICIACFFFNKGVSEHEETSLYV